MELSTEYVAGLFDGEGSIGLYFNKGAPSARYKSGFVTPSWSRGIKLGAVYKPIITALHKKYGGLLTKRRGGKWPDGVTRRVFWVWQLHREDLITAFLLDITPYLKQKKSEALLMLAYNRKEIPAKRAARLLQQAKTKSYK